MHRRSTRRLASSSRSAWSRHQASGSVQVKQRQQSRRNESVRAIDDVRDASTAQRQMDASQLFTVFTVFTTASAQSAPKMCVTCEHAPTTPQRPPAKGKRKEEKCEGSGAYLVGRRNSREAERSRQRKGIQRSKAQEQVPDGRCEGSVGGVEEGERVQMI